MIFVKGTTFWHGVRAIGDRITTLCGRELPGNGRILKPPAVISATFLCRTCDLAMRRSA